MRIVEFLSSDYEIHNRPKLDRILVELCHQIIKGQQDDPVKYGMVAACVLDPQNRIVFGVNEAAENNTRRHAERVAMDKYVKQHGEIPEGSIIVTSLSPCSDDMDERYGESCTDLVNNSNVRKVYCGYIDPSQKNQHGEYTLEETDNNDIKELCKKFADTFLDELNEEASGVIATNKQARDPRYSMSLTKDVRPGQIAKNLKAFSLEETLLKELNIAQTLKFIQQAHGDQLYGQLPYWHHPRAVAIRGKKIFGGSFNSDAVKVAFLHDVVEDTHIGLDEISKLGFAKEVVEAVGLLTKNKSLTYSQNIENIINSGNRYAMMVKYADNYENFSGDKSSWDPKRAESSQKKYLASLNMLGDKLGVKAHIATENFADGKNPGRKGLAKRSGVNTKASVSSLRNTAKHSTGEKQRMAHWLANMKAGKDKKK